MPGRRVIAVIPARYASTRLPAKPLLRETGKYLIQHVWERVAQARGITAALVATDDPRIAEAVRSFGGTAVMTSPDHRCGTDRLAEVMGGRDEEIVVNVQGDEPEIDPAAITLVAELVAPPSFPMATLATPLRQEHRWRDPAQVKVVLDQEGAALYFSRAPIPAAAGGGFPPDACLGHVGLYAYTRDFLLGFARLPPTRLERVERLEQLRAIENGVRIRVGLIEETPQGIDTPEDYRRFVERTRGR
jgi:3-deoxy-manno-octulosonate cytidylyltransferase (CMP-KDO synthetase)